MIDINNSIHIPLSECEFAFSTSRGPGGQHANRNETRVMLRFDIAHSPSLTAEARERLLSALHSRLTKEGVLLINVQKSRSQIKNRETAVTLLQTILTDALKPRKKRKKRKASRASKERRLAKKKKQSQLKESRQKKW